MTTEIIQNLANSKNITIAKMLRDLKIGQGTFTTWKKECRTPNIDALQKIADYFDVSIDYLVGRTEEKNISSQGKSLSEQEYALLEYFRSTSEQGKMKIIQTVMNICDEIEKKDTDQNTKATS